MRSLKPKREKRREVGKIFLATLLFFLFFPYLSSLLAKEEGVEILQKEYASDVWIEMDRLWGEERIPMEEYLVGMMAATVPLDYERETLKAQAIMLRSWCLSLAKKEDGLDIVPDRELETAYLGPEDCKRLWQAEYETNVALIQEILKETEGMVLVKGGQIVSPPFFRLSSGTTRVVNEYQAHSEQWAYLISVDCPQDVEASNYLERIELREKEFAEKVGRLLGEKRWVPDKIILQRDSADYVKTVQIGEKEIQGEDFRYALGLASSCFTLEKQNDIIVIKTKGIGHGFGFSQHQANELAKQGQTYRQLLETFFSGLTIEKI